MVHRPMITVMNTPRDNKWPVQVLSVHDLIPFIPPPLGFIQRLAVRLLGREAIWYRDRGARALVPCQETV